MIRSGSKLSVAWLSVCLAAPLAVAHAEEAAVPGYADEAPSNAPAGIVPVPTERASVHASLEAPRSVDLRTMREAQAITFAGDLTERARALLDDSEMLPLERRLALRSLVLESFDVDTVGRMLLGPNRVKLDKAQMENYRALVSDYLVPLYVERIRQVCGREPVVIAVQERPTGVFVRTAYTQEVGAQPVLVDWFFNPKPDGSWRAIDMRIDGVSLAQLKMDEFRSVIDSQGPDALLALLTEQASTRLPEAHYRSEPLTAPIAPAAPATATE